MKAISTRTVFAAVVVGLALVAGQTSSEARAATPYDRSFAPLVSADLPTTSIHFATLDAAVAAGKLDRQVVTELRRNGSVNAIVTVDESTPTRGAQQSLRTRIETFKGVFAARKSAALLAPDGGVEVLRAYENLPSTFVRFESEDALLDVVNAATVARVRANVSMPVATQQSLALIKQPQAAAAGRIGTGTYVAVLDTGVDYTRAPFGCTAPSTPSTCKVALSREMDGDTETYLDEGSYHGTNVAGIVSSVAPGAKILAYDVFDWKWNAAKEQNELRSDHSDQLQAINDIIARKQAGLNIVAFNMSLGGGHYTTACDAGLNFATARSLGILPIVAAGNARFVENAFRLGIAAPACDANAVSVGATTDSAHAATSNCSSSTGADQITSFSQTASILTLVAPGQCIVAAGIEMQGTSQATPHVAGAVAVLAAARFGSNLLSRSGADQIITALRNSGPSIYDSRSGVSRKRLDVQAALQTLLGTSSSGDTTAPTVTTPQEVFDGAISASNAPVRISWSATDPSGIAAYEVWARTNGGAWTQQTAVPATATSFAFTLNFGTKYEFAVKAKDGAGNWSAFQYGPAVTPKATDDGAFQISGSPWSRYSWSGYTFGGTAITTSQSGAWLEHSFTGRDVALIAPMSSVGGRAHIYCDGAFKATIDLYSATLRPRESAYWCSFAQYGAHTMKLVVEGTTYRPRIDVDAFVTLS